MELFDITIVGGGASGLFSAFYSGLRERKIKLLEAEPRFGGKMNVFLEKMLWDVGGQPPIVTREFLKNLIEQANVFSPTISLNEKVNYIDKKDDYFVLSTNNGEHYSKSVIVAIGEGIIKPHKLTIEGAEKYEKTNLHYELNEIEPYREKNIVISGGGDTAVDCAFDLLPVTKKITVVYRGENLKGLEAFVTELKNNNVELMLNTELKELHSNEEDTHITSISIEHKGEIMTKEVDDLFICYGYEKRKSLKFGPTVNPKRVEEYYLESIGDAKTTVPGIFVVGDMADYNDKVRLFAGAFQDAILGVNSAISYIDPDEHDHGLVSSHNEIFIEKNKEVVAQKSK